MAPLSEHEALRRRQRSNIIVAKFIPAFLTAVVIYASYVFVGPLCINYLINTPQDAGVSPRINLGIALPIVYFFLLILMALCYLRLLLIVCFDPGYIQQRPTADKNWKPVQEKRMFTSCAANHITEGQELEHLDYEGILRRGVPPPAGIEQFYEKDAFVCDRNGLPMWCHTCGNWKADRVHHSRDVGRCVKKMDHFCPWVGGMVGENGYKFFVQFNIYAALFSFYTMSVMAYFVAEAKRNTNTIGDVQWIVVLGLGAFFGVFTYGLAQTSIQYSVSNLTTVEHLDKGFRSMFIAVLLPPELQRSPSPAAQTVSRSAGSEMPLRSEIDDPSHQSYFSNEQRPSRSRRRSREVLATSIWQGTITYPLDLSEKTAGERRTYAILRTPQGMNPWDIGWKGNLAQVLGNSFHAWLLPYLRSPCTDHSSAISRYPLGWEFEQLLSDARLFEEPSELVKEMVSGTSTSTRKKKRKLAHGWQNGERPDGWILEKEARRMRRGRREMPALPP